MELTFAHVFIMGNTSNVGDLSTESESESESVCYTYVFANKKGSITFLLKILC